MSRLVEQRKTMADKLMRDAICDAAAAVLAEVGFTVLTMERVAEAAGVSKGTLYNYFEDKDALALEVIERTFAPLYVEVDRVLAEDRDIPEILLDMTRTILTGIEQHRALGQVLCGRELSPRLNAALRERHLRARMQFTEMFRRAAAAGRLRVACADPDALGRTFAVVLRGVIDERIRYAGDCPSVDDEILCLERFMIRPWFTEKT